MCRNNVNCSGSETPAWPPALGVRREARGGVAGGSVRWGDGACWWLDGWELSTRHSSKNFSMPSLVMRLRALRNQRPIDYLADSELGTSVRGVAATYYAFVSVCHLP